MSNRLYKNILEKIPPNKFIPPCIDQGKHLAREKFISAIANRSRNKSVILVTAQAGQGKTIFARQYLDYCQTPFVWYQAGREDKDPVYFFATLLTCLKDGLSEFHGLTTGIEKLFLNHSFQAGELNRGIDALFYELDKHLSGKIYLVLDDLHLVVDSAPSLALIDYMLDTAPPRMRFILLSRQDIHLKSRSIHWPVKTLKLENKDLCLDQLEAFTLFDSILKIDVPLQKIKEIHRDSRGWIMGILLAGLGIKSGKMPQHCCYELDRLKEFFMEVILAEFSFENFLSLAGLSLLDTIPVSLARQICGDQNIETLLVEMERKNYFTSSNDAQGQTFKFHHLFQEVLREIAIDRLDSKEINTVLALGARYCLENDLIENSCQYSLRAGDFDSVAQVLQDNGIKLMALNRTASIRMILEAIPEKNIYKKSWLALFAGLVYMQSQPRKCLPFLKEALQLFQENNDQRGQLIVYAHLLYFNQVFLGLYGKASELLTRAEKLYNEISMTLSIYERVLLAKIIALGCIVLKTDPIAARPFYLIAMDLSEQHNITSFKTSLLCIPALEHIFLSQAQESLVVMERSREMLVEPQCSPVDLMILRSVQLSHLATYGDFDNYHYYEGVLIGEAGKDLLEQSLIGPYIYLWRTGINVAQVRLDKALQQIINGKEGGVAATNAYLRQLFLHWQAYILALKGKKKEAMSLAAEALKLADTEGSPYSKSLTKIMAGAAYIQLALYDQAEETLRQAAFEADAFGNELFRATAHFFLAYLHLQRDELSKAGQYAGKALQCMREKKCLYFLPWSNEIVEATLSFAVKNNIETDYAGKLARQRLNKSILADGVMIPLLRIKMLADFKIFLGDKVICGGVEELPPALRDLLVLLIASPGLKISQQQVQLIFWPDSAPDKSRAKFDALLSRLRRQLATTGNSRISKNYLKLKKGILSLENCKIDTLSFMDLVKDGFKHLRYGELWQAENGFRAGVELWQGYFDETLSQVDQFHEFSCNLLGLLSDAACKLGIILSESGRIQTAIEVVNKAFKYDLANGRTATCLYQLHIQNNDVKAAKQALARYENGLRMADFKQKEIDGMLLDFMS